MPDGLWDGEWLARPQQFVVFDLLRGPAGDLRGEPCEERWRSLTNLLIKAPACLGPRVSIVSSPGRLEKHKRGFLAELHRQAAEGAIFKRALAPYRPGAAGDMLRLKFRKRADVILQLRTGDTKASAEMFVMHEGKPFHVGTVAARTFFRRLQVGSVHVAEVEYLSASDSYALAQVVILRLRTDKAPEQCTRDQIVIGKRYRTAGGQ
jgi:ATP-dependent DNA ligase